MTASRAKRPRSCSPRNGYIPPSWKTSVTLEGEVNLQRYFYPSTPKPIRAGIYRFISNTPNADLKEVLSQTEAAVAAQLFKQRLLHAGADQDAPGGHESGEAQHREDNVKGLARNTAPEDAWT